MLQSAPTTLAQTLPQFATIMPSQKPPARDKVPIALRRHRDVRSEGKLAEEVAAQIEADIVALGWPVGRVLGSEAVLLERYGISRAAFREAVRLLEVHMVARMRPGPGGGLVVMQPDSEAAVRAIALYLSFVGVDSKQLLDVRGLIEGYAAATAAVEASPTQRRELAQYLEIEKGEVEASHLNAKSFHVHVAEMCANPVIQLFVRCMVDLTEQQTTPEDSREHAALRVNNVHRKIGEAIIAGDAEQARRLMISHVLALDPWLGEAGRKRARKPSV
ncbi:FadR/GntR family transcriptional regulator [Paraburkholderia pallida]|uniref:FadR family transcriptional regulator n=1 Tax=Paraburkholderia pallida TaxID=2547399 RepID=A0A4P7CT03_9BURK|nr:FCD domain-containing protein [Paraburkholderia pallida]QBQ99080.1 FadR family transcriptional regulator [Paraburkholderia pallida]